MAGLVMLTVRASDADSLVTRLFRKSGAPPSHANVVARHLVESSQLGVHSHGLIRVPQYVHEIRSGHLDPRAKPRRLGRHGAVSWVSGNSGFGQVGAIYSALAATASARRYGVGLVIAKNLGHTGRLGAYAELVANERCVAVLFGNGPPSSHLVAPFGGIDGRLATTPLHSRFQTDLLRWSPTSRPVQCLRANCEWPETWVGVCPQAFCRIPSATPRMIPACFMESRAGRCCLSAGPHLGTRASHSPSWLKPCPRFSPAMRRMTGHG